MLLKREERLDGSELLDLRSVAVAGQPDPTPGLISRPKDSVVKRKRARAATRTTICAPRGIISLFVEESQDLAGPGPPVTLNNSVTYG